MFIEHKMPLSNNLKKAKKKKKLEPRDVLYIVPE
jgi:hypothetical protein